MSLLSDGEKGPMLALVQETAMYDTTVRVLHATTGADDVEGRQALTWPDHSAVADSPGSVLLKFSSEQRDGMWVTVGRWTGRVPVGTTVQHGDRLYDAATGMTFEITTANPKNSIIGLLYIELSLVVMNT